MVFVINKLQISAKSSFQGNRYTGHHQIKARYQQGNPALDKSVDQRNNTPYEQGSGFTIIYLVESSGVEAAHAFLSDKDEWYASSFEFSVGFGRFL